MATLIEAAISATSRQLRSLFPSMLLFSHPSRPGLLWEKLRSDTIEGFLRNDEINEDRSLHYAISKIDASLWRKSKRWKDSAGLPSLPEISQSFLTDQAVRLFWWMRKRSKMLSVFSKTLKKLQISRKTRNRFTISSTKQSTVHQKTKCFSWADQIGVGKISILRHFRQDTYWVYDFPGGCL